MIRAAFKSLLARKVRLLMSTFAIVLGVAFVVGSLVFSDTLGRSFTALFASTVGDVVVSPEGRNESGFSGDTRSVPASVVRKLSRVEGAARADGNILDPTVYVVGTDNKVVGSLGAPGLAGNWTGAPAGHGLEGLQIISGRAPAGEQEVVLDAATSQRTGYRVGDQVRLVTTSSQAVLTPTLVGIVDFGGSGSFNGASFVAFDTPTAQKLFMDGRRRFHDVWVTAQEGISQEELRDRVSEVLPKRLTAETGDDVADANASQLLEGISFLTTFLLIFAGISLVVGAFLIVNTFSILVAQRSRELALLRAMGASRHQVTGSVLLEAFVLGILGSTLGLGLGYVLAMVIRTVFGEFGLDLSGQPLIFRRRTVVAAYVIGVLVTMAAVWLPAHRTGRIAPVQAMRDDVALPTSSLRQRFGWGMVLVLAGGGVLFLGLFTDVPRAGWLVGAGILAILLGVAAASPVLSKPALLVARGVLALAFGAVGRLAGQNSLRNPRRTTATASALMIGLALAGTMAILGDSAKASVDRTIEENFRGDYIISSVFGQPFSAQVRKRVARVDGVENVVRQRFGFAEIDGDPQGMTGATVPALRGLLGLRLVEGRLGRLGTGRVLLAQGFAEENGLTVGDRIPLVVNGASRDLKVVGIHEENPLLGFPLVTTPTALKRLGFPEQDNFLILEVARADAATYAALQGAVADLPTVSVKDQGAFAAEQRAPIDQLVLMIFALLGLALLIAVLGIVNTLALSVIERTREVGLLRAIGLSRAQLRWMITLESVVIAGLGAVLGVGLGVGFGIALMYALRDQGLEVISVPWDQLVIFLVVSLVVGVLAAVLPARRAARLDVLRAIATE